jgi:mRNA interferase HigB
LTTHSPYESIEERNQYAPNHFRQDAAPYSEVQKQLNDWNDIVKGAEWQSLIDVQVIYRDAEAVENFTVFNIKGNKYRLIVSIDYEAPLIYYKYFLTHAEYDKENWKNDDYY